MFKTWFEILIKILKSFEHEVHVQAYPKKVQEKLNMELQLHVYILEHGVGKLYMKLG